MHVYAGDGNWAALLTNNSLYLDGDKGFGPESLPRTMPPLRAAWASQVLAGIEKNGRVHIWNVRPALKQAFKPPPAGLLVQDIDLGASGFHALAVTTTGSVIGWGPRYEQADLPWQPLPDITDAVSCACTQDFRAVLRKDGSLVVWTGRDPMKLPPDVQNARFLKLTAGGGQLMGLVSDGTVRVWGKRNEFAAPPAGLSDVVDIAAGPNLWLALRANGEWVGWGSDEDKILRDLPKLAGARRAAIGGNGKARFIIGVQSD